MTHRSPQHARSLRGWLRHLAGTCRLAVARKGVALEYELAAIAKKLDGSQAVLFPEPGGYVVPIVSGHVASRAWIAEHGIFEEGKMGTGRYDESVISIST